MAGGMCPHIFGAWCPHYTAACSEDQRTGRCIHLPAFMISSSDDDYAMEFETARQLFQSRKPGPREPET